MLCTPKLQEIQKRTDHVIKCFCSAVISGVKRAAGFQKKNCYELLPELAIRSDFEYVGLMHCPFEADSVN